MADSRLKELRGLGQSVWIDFLSKELLDSGHLAKLITEDGLTGVTSNPTIFQKAMQDTRIYDERIKALVAEGVTEEKEIFLRLALDDIRHAAGLLQPVHQETGGMDGFVSIEVSPDLAYNTTETIMEARRLFSDAGRENVLVKVPGTKEGLPAIERLISDGVNVNVTLLFSVERYSEAADAYMRGLEARAAEGLPLEGITSVASFFISRIDTLVDTMLDAKARGTSPSNAERMLEFRGRAGISSARLAYERYKEIAGSDRFVALREKGAKPQMLLWGSTSVKDPVYRDTLYVEELIGLDTINTMPEETLNAFRDHGVARPTLEKDLDEARRVFEGLGSIGIDMRQVTSQLVKEGVRKFSESFFDVMGRLAAKREMIIRKLAA
ncbi:MAG TPA: transaldolase [Nitrospirota bacterium]